MKIQGTYKFEKWNVEFTNPYLEVLQDTISIQPSKMTIGVYIILSITLDNGRMGKFGYQLKNIPVDNLSFNPKNENDVNILVSRVINKLEDFKL